MARNDLIHIKKGHLKFVQVTAAMKELGNASMKPEKLYF